MDEYDMIARDVAHKSHHGSAGLEEPVKAELGRVAYALAQLIINALLVKAQLVQHADEKSILLLGVVLAFVGAVRDPELMERRLITANLKSKTKHYAFQCNFSIVYEYNMFILHSIFFINFVLTSILVILAGCFCHVYLVFRNFYFSSST